MNIGSYHLVVDPDIIKLSQNTLRICHLVMKYDDESKTLVFDRKLKEGHGESLYGLEVAMSLSIDPEFIRRAMKRRRKLLGTSAHFLNTKTSRYGKDTYMDSCSRCGKPYTQGNPLHTHHIQEQHKADSNGYIDHYHKDSQFNRINLCSECHKFLHSTEEKITIQQTITGNLFKIPADSSERL